jgi:hypothetical protein
MMLDKLTSADFSAHLNQKFHIRYQPETTLEVELIEVTKLGPEDIPGRRPFSLIFRSSQRNSYLPQHVYTLEHNQMEKMELFLVPIGPDEVGMRYQAIFT